MRTDLGDVAVLDAGGLVQVFPLDPLGGEAAAGDGRPAAEGLELGVNNLSVVINLSRENLSININAPTKYNPLMPNVFKTAVPTDIKDSHFIFHANKPLAQHYSLLALVRPCGRYFLVPQPLLDTFVMEPVAMN